MKFQYWKNHDTDRWFWQLTSHMGEVIDKGNVRTQDEIYPVMGSYAETMEGLHVEYRDKPAN
jgi:hypothetical protein